jgi:hypothetical protein
LVTPNALKKAHMGRKLAFKERMSQARHTTRNDGNEKAYELESLQMGSATAAMSASENSLPHERTTVTQTE